MQQNQVSQTFTPTELTNTLSTLQTLIATLEPKMATLTAEERQNIAKMSDKTIAFVTKTVNYCDSNPEFVPSYLDLDELKKDLALVNDLKQLLDKSVQLHQMLEDTIMLAGSEAYLGALLYYNNLKGGMRQGIISAEPIYNDLSERFPGRRRANRNQANN